MHGRRKRLEIEERLRRRGLRPTRRRVDLRLAGLSGMEQTATWEYTFPLGIHGHNLLLVSAELDGQEGESVPLVVGVPAQAALGVTIRWPDFTFDMEALAVRGAPFNLSGANHPEVEVLAYADTANFGRGHQLDPENSSIHRHRAVAF